MRRASASPDSERAPKGARGLALALAACALFTVLLFVLPERAPRTSAEGARVVAGPEGDASLATLHAAPREPARTTEVHVRAQPSAATISASVEPPPSAPAVLAGRVTLDGRAPEPGARVGLREEGETRWFPLDPEGRFRVEGVSPGASVLAFALPPTDGRTVLVPERTLEVAPGATAELVLDWRSRHVNLKVTGDLGGWNQAQVRLEGPGWEAELETDDEGRAGLTLVEGGSFVLRAQHPAGRSGSATLVLDEDSDLASVVIRLADGG